MTCHRVETFGSSTSTVPLYDPAGGVKPAYTWQPPKKRPSANIQYPPASANCQKKKSHDRPPCPIPCLPYVVVVVAGHRQFLAMKENARMTWLVRSLIIAPTYRIPRAVLPP